MVFPDFDPVIFHLGPLAIRWYALAYVAGILLGWWYLLRLLKTPRLWTSTPAPLTREEADDLILWITLGIIVGGRLGSVIFYNTEMIWTRPLEIFAVWRGGMSFHGGLIGVAIALLLFARSKKTDVLRISDVIAPCVPFGLFFGRIANFINGELWGRPTDLPWGVSPHAGDVPLHPSQLYEATLEGIVLFIILRMATHRFGQLQRKGAMTGLFLLCYGIFRILVEQVRAPDANLSGWPLGLTMGIVLSVPMAIAGAWLIYRSRPQMVEPEAKMAAAPVIAAVPPAPVPAKAAPKPKAKAAPAKAAPTAKPPVTKAPVKVPTKALAKKAPAKPAAAAKPKPKARPKPKS